MTRPSYRWIKVDAQFAHHEKFLDVSPTQLALWLHALAYSASMETDGFLSEKVVNKRLVPQAGVEPEDVDGLVDAGLWDEVEGGWQIHDYGEYQSTREDIEDRRRQKADAGSKGGVASGISRRQQGEAPASGDPKQPLEAGEADSRSSEPRQETDKTRSDVALEEQRPETEPDGDASGEASGLRAWLSDSFLEEVSEKNPDVNVYHVREKFLEHYRDEPPPSKPQKLFRSWVENERAPASKSSKSASNHESDLAYLRSVGANVDDPDKSKGSVGVEYQSEPGWGEPDPSRNHKRTGKSFGDLPHAKVVYD